MIRHQAEKMEASGFREPGASGKKEVDIIL